jgi:hypothetical protein
MHLHIYTGKMLKAAKIAIKTVIDLLLFLNGVDQTLNVKNWQKLHCKKSERFSRP